MANMYPTEVGGDVSFSEATVFESLKSGLRDHRWHVIHGKRFVIAPNERSRAEEGELDFLIIHPDRGILGLEVKGGQVGRDQDGWFSISKRDSVRHSIKDPGQQVQQGIHKLLGYVRRRATHPQLTKLPYCWGVAFPGVTNCPEDLAPELSRKQIMDWGNLREPEPVLVGIFQLFGREEEGLSDAALDELIRILLPQFNLAPAPTRAPIRLFDQIEEERTYIVRLTDDQKAIVDNMAPNTRVCISGAAGTGKTLVAMERARRLASQGMKVLFLCYNRPLAQHLAGSAEDAFTVKNFHTLCRDLARDAYIPFIPPNNRVQNFWDNEAPDKLLEALKHLPDARWDAIIVDEGQDFKDIWWIGIEELLVSKEKGILWVFFDPEQDLFDGGSINHLHLIPGRLTWNCRNTQRIGVKAYSYLDLDPHFRPDSPRGVEVEEVFCTNNWEMTEEVRKSLHWLLNEEKIPSDRVLVLSPRSIRSSTVWRQRTFGNYTLVKHTEVPTPNEVGFSSIRTFKGLEADAVILCEIEHGSDRCSANHLYVGASRANSFLRLITYRNSSSA